MVNGVTVFLYTSLHLAGLMFNCSMSCGHYWGLMLFDGMHCTSRKVAGASGYHPDEDKQTGKGHGGEGSCHDH